MFAGRHLSAALGKSALLPAGPAHFGEIRSAKSGEFAGGVGDLDGAAAVSQFITLVPAVRVTLTLRDVEDSVELCQPNPDREAIHGVEVVLGGSVGVPGG